MSQHFLRAECVIEYLVDHAARPVLCSLAPCGMTSVPTCIKGKLMTNLFQAVGHTNLGETVYSVISAQLIKGGLRPGDRLRIRDIAAQMGTSVTPVRDALLRLVQDRGLVFQNARDIRVPHISADEYLEIRMIRVELEGLAAAQAAQRADEADIDRLLILVNENEEAIKAGDFARGTETNQLFHFELARVAKAPELLEILTRLWIRMGPIISEVYEQGGRSMIEHHYDIVQAIKDRNPRAARSAMREDIESAGELILRLRTQDRTLGVSSGKTVPHALAGTPRRSKKTA
ncbi:GntR family transcriptional regulator [Paraburkholderia sp. BL27I4N3]|nr:GntR family transcriptional regulator [Paraburkholderia sp. BL27I4N3]